MLTILIFLRQRVPLRVLANESGDQSLISLPLQFFQIDSWVKKEGKRRIKRGDRSFYPSGKNDDHCTSLSRNIIYKHSWTGDLHHWLRAAPGTGVINTLEFPYSPVFNLRKLWWAKKAFGQSDSLDLDAVWPTCIRMMRAEEVCLEQ